jgi:hypothetical protein
MRAAIIAGLVGMILLPGVAPSEDSGPSSCDADWSPEVAPCAFEMVWLEPPFRVRGAHGTLTSEGGLPWPEQADIAIELVDSRDHTVRYLAHANRASGKFRIKAVRPGEYCFRVGVRPGGWSCVEGRIKIIPTAAAVAGVNATVPLGK